MALYVLHWGSGQTTDDLYRLLQLESNTETNKYKYCFSSFKFKKNIYIYSRLDIFYGCSYNIDITKHFSCIIWL